jgi:N-acetylglucosamine kinase-like BadF-type ATPase
MRILFADSGSTKTHWALVEEVPGLPKMIRTAQTQGLNPLYVTPEQITSACRQVLADVGEGPTGVDELRFYGSGCSGERIAVVERALRAVFTPMTKVIVDSDLMGAALALKTKGEKIPAEPFIACIMGTGSIAALFDPATRALQPMPALGYVLGDEGSGAWFGRNLLGDYLKRQMPEKVREAFEDDFGVITAESAIRHVYQMPTPNRYLATFAAFVGRHQDLPYVERLAYRGVEAFWQRNVLPIDLLDEGIEVRDVRLVGSLAWSLRPVIERVAEVHGYVVSQVIKDPIEGLI